MEDTEDREDKMKTITTFSYENLMIWVTAFAILSLMIERALYQVYQTRLWKHIERKLDAFAGGDYADLKPWVSIAVCVYITYTMRLDLPAFLFEHIRKPDVVRMVLTGLFLSGGSTAIMWIFKRAGQVKAAAHGAKITKINGNE